MEWWLEDLGSRNGSYVNGQRCSPQRAVAVPFGATIMIGDMQFELVE